jgi:hypothetical protein
MSFAKKSREPAAANRPPEPRVVVVSGPVAHRGAASPGSIAIVRVGDLPASFRLPLFRGHCLGLAPCR